MIQIPTATLSFRATTDADFDWVYALKVAAEKDYIRAVFGWDEALQRQLHRQEWAEARPDLILLDNEPVGTCLLQLRAGTSYFGRFFIQPALHNQGLGSRVLQHLTHQLDEAASACELWVLQGNPALRLYQRFGFVPQSSDAHFHYLLRAPGVTS